MDTAEPQVPPHYRAAGALLITSGLMNLMMASIWFLSLVWMCGLGAYWFVPMAVAIGEVVVGTLAVNGVRMRFLRAATVISGINGLVLFDVYAVTMAGIAFVLQFLDPVPEWLALEDAADL